MFLYRTLIRTISPILFFALCFGNFDPQRNFVQYFQRWGWYKLIYLAQIIGQSAFLPFLIPNSFHVYSDVILDLETWKMNSAYQQLATRGRNNRAEGALTFSAKEYHSVSQGCLHVSVRIEFSR